MARSTKRAYNNTLDADEKRRIVDDYSVGAATLTELAARYGVSASSIKGWARLARKTRTPMLRATGTPPALTVAPLPIVLLPTHKPTAAEVAEQVALANTAALHTASLLEAMLRDALVTVKTDPGAGAGLIRAAAHASEIAERVMKMRRATLRMDKENSSLDRELPELQIRDMTTDEERRIRRRQELEDQGADPDSIDEILDREFKPGADRLVPQVVQAPMQDDQEDEDRVVECEDDEPPPAPAEPAQARPQDVPAELIRGKMQVTGRPMAGFL